MFEYKYGGEIHLQTEKILRKLFILVLISTSLLINMATISADNEQINKVEIGTEEKLTIALLENIEKLNFSAIEESSEKIDGETKESVRTFLKYFDLEVDGKVNEEDLTKIVSILSATDKHGEIQNAISKVKQLLVILGYIEQTISFDVYSDQVEDHVQDELDFRETDTVEKTALESIDTITDGALSNPMYREDVIPLKEKLEFLGFGSFNMTDYYGPQTEQAVRDFQRFYGLTVDGIVEDATLQKLDQVANGPLRNRMNRQDVIPLKENLQHLGYGSFNMTDLFATATEAAVRAFQSDYQDYYDLSVNGIADSDTVSALEEIANTPFQYENRHNDTRILKDYLYNLGFWDSKNGTNLYGSRMEEAVRDFQSSTDLRVTGIADPITWVVLEEKATGPLQNMMYREDVIQLNVKIDVLCFGSFN